ncbi:MAG: DUF302 domain-containing protein [Marinibacterium sp.]
MRSLFTRTATALALSLVTGVAAQAGDAIVYDYDGSFDDATFAVESAILDHGLVIDLTSHVGDMLNRTGADVGSDVEIFGAADIYSFCSAVISRKVMEADPANIVYCPYGIYVAQQGDKVTIGHRDYPDGAMQAVEDLLTSIVKDAMDG